MSVKDMPVARIVTSDKVVNSKVLNVLGAQVLRTVAARSIYNLMPASVDQTVSDKVEQLKRDGMIMWPNFLPPELFEQARQECLESLDEGSEKSLIPKLKVTVRGPNTYRWIDIRDFPQDGLPATRSVFADPRLNGVMQGVEKRPLDPTAAKGKRKKWTLFQRTIEWLTQGPISDEEDEDTRLHSDIFFNTHKAWLYLHDIGMEHGPFVYVKGSHRLTPTQLRYIYRESCGRNMGSRRITPDELEKMGLQETTVTCPQNTLVIANSFGYHRRLRGTPGSQRYSLHVSLRANPFMW